MTQEKTNDQLLLDAGREAAVGILQQAVSTATTPEQLNNQLHVLNCLAVHILATNIFNRLKSFDESEASIIMETKELIEDELAAIKAHTDELEVIHPEQMKNAEQ